MKNFPRISLVAILVLAIIICGLAILGAFASTEAFIPTGVCTAPPPSLVSWWPGDGNSNDIEDGNNGTLQGGATFAPGMVGQAFNFDGVDDRVMIPDSPSLRFGTGDLSVDAWIKAPPGTDSGDIIGKELQTFPFPSILLRLEGGKVSFGVLDCGTGACGFSAPGGGGSRQMVISPFRVDDNIFHHVAGVRRPSGYELYIDGALVATHAEPARNPDSNAPLFIGMQSDNPSLQLPFTGVIDEVEIFNRALAVFEIQAIFNAGSAGKCKPTPTPTPSPTPTPTPPLHVGPPTNKEQCKKGGWQTFDTPRHFKNQGDCIQFVNTGK